MTWHVIDWRLDKKAGAFSITLGVPVVESGPVLGVNGEPFVDEHGQPMTRERLVGFDRCETVLFSADEQKHTHHAGRRLRDEKVLERHMAAVAEAWGDTVELDPVELPDYVGMVPTGKGYQRDRPGRREGRG